MADLLIEGDLVLTMDPDRRMIADGAVAVEGTRIVEVGKAAELRGRHTSAKVIPGRSKLVLPGLVNCHTHIFQSLYRGLGDDRPLQDWLRNVVYRLSGGLDLEGTRAAARLSCLEMIRTGTTTFADCYNMHVDKDGFHGCAEAVEESGLRALLARATGDLDPIPERFREDVSTAVRECERMIQRWNGRADGRITICPSPTNLMTSSNELVRTMKEMASHYKVGCHTHVASTLHNVNFVRKRLGKSYVEYLESLGVLGPDLLAAHCACVTDREIRLMRDTETRVAHCPVANSYLGYGVAPVLTMLREGVVVGLGTDGAASNNCQDLVQSMKMCAILHKNHMLDPSVLTAEKVIEMATIDAARALGMADRIGSLEAGKQADIVLFDLNRPNMVPSLRPWSNLVYASGGADVDTVIVGGKVLMEKGRVLSLDEGEVMATAQEAIRALVERVGAQDLVRAGAWKIL